MPSKKRKYFKANKDQVATIQQGYLLKWIGAETLQVQSEGPFTNIEEANIKLSSFLRAGICSWLVAYYG